MMSNLSILEDPDRFYNWYKAHTKVQFPVYYVSQNQLKYYMKTFATTGNISTRYFGYKFDAVKVESQIKIEIQVFVPRNVRYDKDTTLMFNINKQTMKEVSDNDQMFLDNIIIDADLAHKSANITAPSYSYYTELNRKVSMEDINQLDLDIMPGFRMTWNYNEHLEPEHFYSEEELTKYFVRYLKKLRTLE